MLVLEIVNDGTGSKEIGNYNYRVYINHEVIHTGRLEGYNRRLGAKWLIHEIAHDMEEQE